MSLVFPLVFGFGDQRYRVRNSCYWVFVGFYLLVLFVGGGGGGGGGGSEENTLSLCFVQLFNLLCMSEFLRLC